MEYWNDEKYIEEQRLKSQAERELKREAAKQEKLDKKKRQHGVIPNFIKGKKEGMHREQQITNKWNARTSLNKEPKKANVKQRPSFLDEPEEEEQIIYGSQLPDSFSTKAPQIKPRAKAPEATRQPNSGAMWHAKGDISLEHALMEVKERGSVNSRGEKTISIPKEWLDKQADEAFQENKEFWYLAFAYKGSDDVYIIKPYDDEIEMVVELRRLQSENEELKSKLEAMTDVNE